jgi:mannitol-1-phosphate/altronate dehydrogenase
MVHLGVGNFHRAHQAWYTANSPDSGQWGIAAFTGRRAVGKTVVQDFSSLGSRSR